MAIYSLHVADISMITTSDPDGFDSAGGWQFEWGVSTVTINAAAWSQELSINDTEEEFFDDDALTAQTLEAGATINGTDYTAGTVIEAEYVLVVQDSLGNDYTLQFVSLAEDSITIQGFVIQGPVPPFGEPLTVMSNTDMVNDSYTYAASSPACFTDAVRLATPDGPKRAGALRRGDHVLDIHGTAHRIEQRICEEITPDAPPKHHPVTIPAGALGEGLPWADVTLSPQHRLIHPRSGLFVPLRALIGTAGIDRVGVPFWVEGPVRYIHLVTRDHCLLRAEGLACESFWPGPSALRGLPEPIAARVAQIMGPSPRPVAPLLSVGEARRRLSAGVLAFPGARHPAA